jgi:hypothetical protein
MALARQKFHFVTIDAEKVPHPEGAPSQVRLELAE